MADDLKEELRLIGCHANGDARCTCNIGQDAIDRIEALEAAQKDAEAWARKCASADDRCEAIAAERDSLRLKLETRCADCMGLFNRLAAEAEAIAAERDALRGALVDLADRERTCEANMAFRRKQGWYRDSSVEDRDFSVAATWSEVAKIARAALTGEAKP